MPGEFYFMAVGRLGVTLAGFAGLIAALEGRGGAPQSGPASTFMLAVAFAATGGALIGLAVVVLAGTLSGAWQGSARRGRR